MRFGGAPRQIVAGLGNDPRKRAALYVGRNRSAPRRPPPGAQVLLLTMVRQLGARRETDRRRP